MVERDDEIKVLGEINLELQFSTHKVIEKLSQEKFSQEEALEKFKWKVEHDHEIKVLGEVNVELESGTKKLREKLSQEEDREEEALEEFNSTLDNHFGWDWPEKDSPGTKVDWQFNPLHETEDFFVGLDQPIHVVVLQNNVHEEVAEEVIEMANDQAEALSSDQEVTDECLDDEQDEERRPNKRIRVTQEEMVKDEKPKKG
ncbi:hypothetical protein Tco_0336857 [Tanacetum coccineum]